MNVENSQQNSLGEYLGKLAKTGSIDGNAYLCTRDGI
jgi:hypothetical protein